MPKKNKATVHQRGNPIANNPLMRKGGIHKQSRTSRRQKQKRETRQLIAKYMGTASGHGRGGHYFSRRPSAKLNAKRSKGHGNKDAKIYDNSPPLVTFIMKLFTFNNVSPLF